MVVMVDVELICCVLLMTEVELVNLVFSTVDVVISVSVIVVAKDMVKLMVDVELKICVLLTTEVTTFVSAAWQVGVLKAVEVVITVFVTVKESNVQTVTR